MSKCPHCGQTIRKHRTFGKLTQTVLEVTQAEPTRKWTAGDIARATGLPVNAGLYGSIHYLVKQKKLRRVYRGIFTAGGCTVERQD